MGAPKCLILRASNGIHLALRDVFQDGVDTLRNKINEDVVTPVIQESMLSAEHLGRVQMKVCVSLQIVVTSTWI